MALIAVRRNLTPGAVFFRQSGSKLLYSLDSVSWSEAYDFGRMTTTQAGQTTVNAWSNYNNLTEIYDGDVTNINIKWAPTTGLDETARKQVICYMVDLVLKTKIAQVRELYRLQDQDEDNGLSIAAGILGAAAAVIGIAAVVIGTGGTATIPLIGVGVSGGSLGFIGAGLGLGAIGTELYSALTSPDTLHLDDADAIDAYRCRAYNILTSSPITPETWTLAFAQFADETNEYVSRLSGDVSSLTDTTDMIFALSGLSGLLDGMFAGLYTVPDICIECDDAGPWCFELDFRVQSFENYIERYRHYYDPPALSGEWQAGIGWVATDWFGASRGERKVELAQIIPAQELRFKVRYTYIQGVFIATAGITGPQLWYYPTNNPSGLAQGTLVTAESVYTTASRGGWRVDLRVAFDRIAPIELGDGVGIIERVKIKGNGHNPFGYSNAVYDDDWTA